MKKLLLTALLACITIKGSCFVSGNGPQGPIIASQIPNNSITDIKIVNVGTSKIDLSTITTALNGKLSTTGIAASVASGGVDFSTITTALAGKVSKNGDTISGPLILSASSLTITGDFLDITNIGAIFKGRQTGDLFDRIYIDDLGSILTFGSIYTNSLIPKNSNIDYKFLLPMYGSSLLFRDISDTQTVAVITSSGVVVKSTLTVEGNSFSVGGSTLSISNGLVGIGKNNPSAMLDIAGNSIVGGSMTASSYYGNGSALTGITSGGETNTFTSSKTFTAQVLASLTGTSSYSIIASSGIKSGACITFGDGTYQCTAAKINNCTGDGGIVQTINNYCVHTFLNSGYFTAPLTTGTVTVMIVAGGGGGAQGGGGAGGYLYGTYSIGGSTTVTIGAGGAGGADASAASNGSDTIFGSTTAVGGGAGGSTSVGTRYGSNGGSGGGGAPGAQVYAGGTGSQGHAGGDSGPANTPYGTGAGGGAGAVGGAGTTSVGGNGGDGKQNTISGSLKYYAGGGGGSTYAVGGTDGTGGQGGGGAGLQAGPGINGTNGYGGGGGGVGSAATGGNGGSGVVIVTYPVQ